MSTITRESYLCPHIMQTPLVVAGSRGLCRTFVNRDFNRARQLLEISPALINARHPLGWAPLHAVVLCGDPSLVKFVLDLPGIDITIKDSSTFSVTSLDTDILCRHQELSPTICGTQNTHGATALHFACMRGDLEILNLLLNTHVAHDVRDGAQKLPLDYFDLERVNVDTFKAYHVASQAWYMRWRALAKKDMTVLCCAIREGDHEYCKEILNSKPELACGNHPAVLTVLETTLADRQPGNMNLIPPQLDIFQKRGSTPLHYACLLGNMEVVKVLLRNGAEWTVFDSNEHLPENYASVNGDSKVKEFESLCEEEKSIRREEEELKWAGSFAEALETDREKEKVKLERLKRKAEKEGEKKKLQNEELRKKLAEVEREAEKKKLEKELEEQKKRELQKEEEKKRLLQAQQDLRKLQAEREEEQKQRKLREKDELRIRHLKIEKIVGDQMIGQRGPIRSIASAIRLRENGWVDPDRPLVMLFLGSSGIGKTELAKRLTYFLHQDKTQEKSSFGQSLTEIEKSGAFVRIDMSEYQHSHTVSNLTGSPKGYVGYEEGGILTKKLKANPKAIVLLDEIEKAHPNVLTVFLQVFDDGRITDPKLGTIYCKEAVFIMTSNLGSEAIRAAAPMLHKLVAETEERHEQYVKGIAQFTRQLYPILKSSFKRDEFLGRINQTVVFLPFNHQEISQIVETELKKWKKRAEERHSIRLSWSPKVVDRLAEGYDVNFGARSITNEVQTLAIQIFAESQIRGDIRDNWLVHLFINAAGDIDMAKENPLVRVPQKGCHYVF